MSLLSFLSGILSAIGLNEGLESEDKERSDREGDGKNLRELPCLNYNKDNPCRPRT